MNWKNRLTNYNFWVSMISAVLLIFQAFNLKFDIVYINEIATAVLGLLVVIGIISDPTRTSVKQDTSINMKKESKDEKLKTEESIPIKTENENCTYNCQDDFKVLIEKISADLHNLTQQKTEEKVEENIVQPLLQNVENNNETEPAVEQNTIETISYNIVN